MKFILEHLKTQTIPHDMLEELQNAQVRFYEGCLIVQVQDHRTNAGTSSSTSTNTSKSDKNIPFSIHNYNEHLTPSPYVPYPQKEDAVAEGDKNKDASQAGSDSATASKYKQPEMGPKIFTVVLFPTPLSLHEEVYIQANTPDPRNNRKQSTAVPRTPASATVPATPLSAVPPTSSASGPPPFKKLKMSISGSEIHGFESKAVATTAPPLFLDPVDKIEDTFKVLNTLTDPRYKEDHPAPKARKRTEAELAADEAIAAQEQEFMLIMDERHGASGAAGVKAGTADGEAGGATFEPRFETWQAIKNIRAEHKERAEREAIEKAQKEAQAADNKRRLEQQERLSREQTEHRAAQMAQEQQHLRNMQRQQQMTNNLQPREARRQQQLAASQNQPAHGHPMPNGISQAPKSSPVVRNVTPHNNSSPLVNNISMNGPVTSSPARPTSAMQHGHTGGVAMDQQRSRQRASSRTSTPQMNGTPSMQQATPRLPQGSPPMSMASNPVMNHNVIANQHLNGPPTQLSHQQRIEIIQQRQQQQQYQQQRALMQQPQQRMQNASPNPQMSPDRNPAHMQTLQQAQLNQQRQQQHEYQRSLAMHHQALGNGAGHNNIPNGASPPPQHPGQPGHPQPYPQQQFNPVQNQAQQNYLRQKAIGMLTQQFSQKHGGDPANIPPYEHRIIRQKAEEMGREHFRMVMQQQQRQAQQQLHMQQVQQMQGMGGMNVTGGIMGGQPMTEEQARTFQGMRQFTQMPHIGGAGVQNMNGGQHTPHLNGGGMGGMH